MAISTSAPVASQIFVPTPSEPFCAAESPRWPRTMQIGDNLHGPVEAMLRTSGTFRDQCRRIAESPLVRVTVRKNAGLLGRGFRARSRIERSRSGLILAFVEITPFGSPAEWIAHEFEHVLEQMDGLKLREMADGRGSAWRSSENMFETERAIRAGRAVVDELRRARREGQDKLVE